MFYRYLYVKLAYKPIPKGEKRERKKILFLAFSGKEKQFFYKIIEVLLVFDFLCNNSDCSGKVPLIIAVPAEQRIFQVINVTVG